MSWLPTCVCVSHARAAKGGARMLLWQQGGDSLVTQEGNAAFVTKDGDDSLVTKEVMAHSRLTN